MKVRGGEEHDRLLEAEVPDSEPRREERGAADRKKQQSGVDRELAKEAMRLAGHKLPVRTKFVSREES